MNRGETLARGEKERLVRKKGPKRTCVGNTRNIILLIYFTGDWG